MGRHDMVKKKNNPFEVKSKSKPQLSEGEVRALIGWVERWGGGYSHIKARTRHVTGSNISQLTAEPSKDQTSYFS